MRTHDGQLGIVHVEQTTDERARLNESRLRPETVRSAFRIRQVAPQHRGEAEDVATPVKRTRRPEVTGRASLERLQQARRLVVVFGLARDRQRTVEALAGDQ